MVMSDRTRKFIRITVGLFFLAGALSRALLSQDFRTRIALWRGPMAVRFEPDKPKGFYAMPWGGVYIKTADKSYRDHGRSTAKLTRTFFVIENFTLADVLGDLCECPTTPDPKLLCKPIFLNVEYAERGTQYGLAFEWRFEKDWNVGLRLMGPYREIRVIPILCADPRLRERDTCCVDNEEPLEPIKVLEKRGICLDSPQRKDGVGDIDTELYFGHYVNDWMMFEGRFNVRWPAGQGSRDSRVVFSALLGNNGHFEIMPGAMAAFKLGGNVFFRARGWYSFVLGAHEIRAAAFAGMRARNIGVPVGTHVSWGYFLGDLDLTIRHPDNEYIALTVGYELLAKTRESTHFTDKCGKDVCCNVRELDAKVLEKRTDAIAHRSRLEFSIGTKEGLINFGTSFVFAARNSMRELDVFVGAAIRF